MKDKYKGVIPAINTDGELTYIAQISPSGGFCGGTKVCQTVREAALQVDKWRIERHKEPVNILKRVR